MRYEKLYKKSTKQHDNVHVNDNKSNQSCAAGDAQHNNCRRKELFLEEKIKVQKHVQQGRTSIKRREDRNPNIDKKLATSSARDELYRRAAN